MKIKARQYAQALYETIQGESETRIKELIHNFDLVLVKNNDLKLLPAIINYFQEIWNREQGLLKVELSSARILNQESKNLVLNYLENRLSVSQIDLEEKIDPKLIGGFIIRYGSYIIDASLKNTLFKLRNKINN